MVRLPVISSRVAVPTMLPPTPDDFRASTVLQDAQGRTYSYLRISVTDRCDLACVYCMPPQGEREHGLRSELLAFDEIVRVVRVFSTAGVRRVRLTGGEPLVRKDIVRLVEQLRTGASVDEIVLTTNATRLAELAGDLSRAGLSGVNISLDTLDPDTFERVTRGGNVRDVLAGIHAALDHGLTVKLNTVPVRGVNEHDLSNIVEYAWSIGATPRFIERMPLGEGAKLDPDTAISAADVIDALGGLIVRDSNAQPVAGAGPARYFVAAKSEGDRVGVISAVTNDFCDSCNRVRLTAQGHIRACLASRSAVDLKSVMRSGGHDRDMLWAICYALSVKAVSHYFTDDAVNEHRHVGMSLIGG